MDGATSDVASDVATNSWQAYEAWMQCVTKFLDVIRLRSTDVWVEDSVSLGTASHPWVSAPLEIAQNGGIPRALDLARMVATALLDSLERSIAASEGDLEALRKARVNQGLLAPLAARTSASRQLMKRLREVVNPVGVLVHPVVLQQWNEILKAHLVAGDPRIAVEVTVVRIY